MDLRASQNFTSSYLERGEIRQLIDKAKCFFISGYFVTERNMETIVRIAKFASENDKPLVVNFPKARLKRDGHAISIVFAYKDQWEQLLPYVDILYGNR